MIFALGVLLIVSVIVVVMIPQILLVLLYLGIVLLKLAVVCAIIGGLIYGGYKLIKWYKK